VKSPSDWNEEDLKELIRLQQEENVILDFKRAESLDGAEKKKTEISKDVSAFANSAGGTIVYGIAESKTQPHFAEELSPVDPKKWPKEWLEQIVNSRIQPRISGILINPISLTGAYAGLCAYVVCIPQSETAHQASDHRYYKRFNFESVPMEDYEIRQTMGRTARAAYGIKVEPSQVSERNGIKTFQLNCVIQNTSELLGRDVSAVIFLPDHIILQPDDYRITIEGASYSRIPGTWIQSSRDKGTAIDLHPVTPYRVFFERELRFGLSLPPSHLRVFIRVYDQFGLAQTTRVLLATPNLEIVSSEQLPQVGSSRHAGISPF